MVRHGDTSSHEEQWFRMVVETVSAVSVVVDRDGEIVYSSPPVKTVLGVNPKEFTGESAFLHIDPDDAQAVQRQYQQIINTKNGQTVEGQNKVLSLIVEGAPLDIVLHEVVRQVEALRNNAICGITLLKDNHAMHISPTLPTELTDAINSMEVTDLVEGYLYKDGFVNLSSTDPMWNQLRDWISRNGFSGVWSKPILKRDGTPVAIFSMLYTDGSESNERLTDVFDTFAQFVAIAIEKEQSQVEIAESERQYKALFDNNLDGVYQIDLEGRFITVNQACEEMVGYSSEELCEAHFVTFLAPHDAETAVSVFNQVKRGKTIEFEVSAVHKNGDKLRLHTINLPIFIDGKLTGTFGIAKDVTAVRNSEQLIAHQRRVLEMMARGCALDTVLRELTKVVESHSPTSMCTVFLLQEDRTLHHVTGHERLKRYSDDLGIVPVGPNSGACGTAPFLNEVIIVEDIETSPLFEQYRHIALHHGLRACMAMPIVSSTGTVIGTFGLYYDHVRQLQMREIELLQMVSHLAGLALERKKADEEIEYLAYRDPLTGLPNRTLFLNELKRTLERAKAHHSHLAVMFLDLDRFKSLNDTLGHHFGDRLLEVVADRIKQSLNRDDILARMGGDEFTILLPQIDSPHDAQFVAQRVVDSLRQPIKLDGHQYRITTSVGIALFPDDADSADSLMRVADAAMYEAKGNGKNTFRFYSQSLSEQFYERITMENALLNALDNQEFFLHMQPRLDIASNRVTSVEALLRWNRSGVSLVPPSDFIPIAEETGLIVSIGNWVFAEVCRQIKKWELSGITPIPVAVNVSPRQFQEPNFIYALKQTIQDTGVNPKWLEIEITENVLIEDELEVLANLHELKALGIKVSIDDFGVGYSSLGRLRKMPVDTLKIDRSFIRDMLTDNLAVAKTIITLAHNLNMKVVAEGVETEEQFHLLRQYGCDEIQGYYFTPPIPIEDFEQRYMTVKSL